MTIVQYKRYIFILIRSTILVTVRLGVLLKQTYVSALVGTIVVA